MLLWSYSGSEFAALRVRPTHDPIESMMMMLEGLVFLECLDFLGGCLDIFGNV